MSQLIFLIRHGSPLTDGHHLCIGSGSNPPLSAEGRRQASALGSYFKVLPQIYCSFLARSRETAELISGGAVPVIELDGLEEQSMGLWEGMSFSEIREKYPDSYAARGADWSIAPPDGESTEHIYARAAAALEAILKNSDGDVCAVTHDGVIRALLWRLQCLDAQRAPMPRQPCCSVTVLKYESGAFTVTAQGVSADDAPDEAEIEALWSLCETPENVRRHCKAVCDMSTALCRELNSHGANLPGELLQASALLHDLCKASGKNHPALAARLLRERGYLKAAAAIEAHHDIDPSGELNEAQVLYLADKLISGEARVSLEERFRRSSEKCTTDEAMEMHNRRLEAALLIQSKIQKICETETD